MHPIPISVRYNLKDNEHFLDLYDAGVTLSGFSRSLAISTHYLINNAVIKQAPAIEGAKILLLPSRPGSFVFDFNMLVSPDNFLGAASASIAAAIVWDFIKLIYLRTTGKEYEPSNDYVKGVVSSHSGDVDAIVDTIEKDVEYIHRPIIHNATNVVIFHGDNNLVRFDQETFDYVKTKITSRKARLFVGNVSSFNANTGRGRMFVDKLERTVPFKAEKDNFTDKQKTVFTWSLNEYANGRRGVLEVEAKDVQSQSGLIKSLLVKSVSKGS